MAQTLLGISLLGAGYIAAPLASESNARFAQRPAVAIPVCNDPKPYHIEGWTPNAVGFDITLERVGTDGTLEIERLAQKHKFTIQGRQTQMGSHSFQVSWLDAEQVAALRCEVTVRSIDFLVEGLVATPDVWLPNPSLERP